MFNLLFTPLNKHKNWLQVVSSPRGTVRIIWTIRLNKITANRFDLKATKNGKNINKIHIRFTRLRESRTVGFTDNRAVQFASV